MTCHDMPCHSESARMPQAGLTVILGSVGPESLREGAAVLSGNIFLRRLRLWSNFSDSKSSRRFSLFSPELAGSDRAAVEPSTLSFAGTEAIKQRRRENFILGLERRRGGGDWWWSPHGPD